MTGPEPHPPLPLLAHLKDGLGVLGVPPLDLLRHPEGLPCLPDVVLQVVVFA